MHPARRLLAILPVLLISACALNAALAGAATVGSGEAPRLPDGATTLGALAPQHPLDLTVTLEPRDPSALAAYAEEVSTPGSPVYGHYLSVDEFAARFAPTPTQVAAVRSALTARGLEVGEPAANRLSLPVGATAAEAESAFATRFEGVRLASGEVTYANVFAPSLPAAVAPYVQSVVGLARLARPRPAIAPAGEAHAAPDVPAAASTAAAGPFTGGPQPCAEANAARLDEGYNGYTGDQLAAAYGLTGFYSAGNFGAGQTMALYEEERFKTNDIDAFQRCYGTHVPIEKVDIGGGPHQEESSEAALDIEQVIQLAPGARIRVYQGAPRTTVGIFTAWVSEDVAKVMSSSYGECEHLTEEEEIPPVGTLLQEAAVQGQSFFVASGDYGSADCEDGHPTETELNVDYPGSDPFSTDVGGTRMEAPTAARPVEYLWNEAPNWGAGGGGVSEEFAMPAYQSAAAADTGVIGRYSSGSQCGAATGYCRQVPDVSADAAQETGYVIYHAGEWEVNGGTSAAAPLWGALATLTNASAGCAGHSIGFLNPALYALAGSDYEGNFRDVVEARPGGMPTTNRLEAAEPFPAGPGYDMATGIGTPIGSSLGASLCALVDPPAPPSPPAPAAPSAAAATTAAPTTPTTAAPEPRLQAAHLTDLRRGRPRLRFGLEARSGANLESLSIFLPAGLVPSIEAKELAAGLVVRDPDGRRLKVDAHAIGRMIRIVLPSPRPALRLMLRPPALTVTPNLLAQTRSETTQELGVVVAGGESGGTTTRFPLSFLR